MRLQKHTCSDLTSCYTVEAYQKSLRGRPDVFPHPNSLPTYYLHKLPHSAQSVDETYGSPAFNKLPLRSSTRRASPCNKTALTGNEGCLLLICLVHPYLVITWEDIHET